MAFDLRIITGSNVPIYRQIMDQIRRAVATRQLVEGDQLPSVRALSDRLVINHNTVAQAYRELVRDGVIESRHGRGAFIAKPRQVYTKAERSRRLDQAMESFLSEVTMLGFTAEELETALQKKMKQFDK